MKKTEWIEEYEREMKIKRMIMTNQCYHTVVMTMIIIHHLKCTNQQ